MGASTRPPVRSNQIAELALLDQEYAFVVRLLQCYCIDVTPDEFVNCLNAANVGIDEILAPLMVAEFPFDRIAALLMSHRNVVTPNDVTALLEATPGNNNVVRLRSFLDGLAGAGLRLHGLHGAIFCLRFRAEYLCGMVSVDYAKDELVVFVKAIWLEARDEPYEGQVAVAHVIRNRALINRKHFGGPSITGVCSKERQFLCWNKLDSVQPEKWDAKDVEKWDIIGGWARKVLDGKIRDPTRGAMHYINPAKHNPKWAREMTRGARIASRQFLLGE